MQVRYEDLAVAIGDFVFTLPEEMPGKVTACLCDGAALYVVLKTMVLVARISASSARWRFAAAEEMLCPALIYSPRNSWRFALCALATPLRFFKRNGVISG